MRVTVCELPHEAGLLGEAWSRLREHAAEHAVQLVLLPECAFAAPLWESEQFDQSAWSAAEHVCERWLSRLPDLCAEYVVGTRPVTRGGRRYNEGYLWSAAGGLVQLRRKYYLPNEPSTWEANWFDRGDLTFPAFCAGPALFGLNICTELWALETYAPYAAGEVALILSPRATAAATVTKWLAAGVVGAVRAGAFSVSSNRVDAAGGCGGLGWIINPDGEILATTTREAPFATVDLDLAAAGAARASYPRSVFRL